MDLGLYTKDCLYADPSFSFRGRQKYERNLRTLTAFFISPKIQLYSLSETDQALKVPFYHLPRLSKFFPKLEDDMEPFLCATLSVCVLLSAGGKQHLSFSKTMVCLISSPLHELSVAIHPLFFGLLAPLKPCVMRHWPAAGLMAADSDAEAAVAPGGRCARHNTVHLES